MKFFEACERMIANGEFYRYSGTEYVYKIENDRLKFFTHNDKEWREAVCGMDTLSYAKWERCENPEKPKDERPLRIGTLEKMAWDCEYTQSSESGVKATQHAEKWKDAINTFLRLKSAQGAYSLKNNDKTERFAVIFLNSKSGILGTSQARHDKDLGINIKISFKNANDAEKAIESIGEEPIIQMLKNFAGIE